MSSQPFLIWCNNVAFVLIRAIISHTISSNKCWMFRLNKNVVESAKLLLLLLLLQISGHLPKWFPRQPIDSYLLVDATTKFLFDQISFPKIGKEGRNLDKFKRMHQHHSSLIGEIDIFTNYLHASICFWVFCTRRNSWVLMQRGSSHRLWSPPTWSSQCINIAIILSYCIKHIMFTKLNRVLSCRLYQIYSNVPMMSRLSVKPVEHIEHTKGPPNRNQC